jgi:hypothetical protein
MTELWPLNRGRAQPQALHHSYEKAGLTLADQPIPWNAEAVLVEALLRLPPSGGRKVDFVIRIPGKEPIPAEALRRLDGPDRHRATFRLAPPGTAVTAEVLFRNRVLGQLELPYLSREDFVRGLRLEVPTVSVRLGDEVVACGTFVASQCRGLLASALLKSPTSLAPLLDLDCTVEVHCERTGQAWRAPVRLSGTQLTARQALVTVAPRCPRRIGGRVVSWLLDGERLASLRVRAIGQRQFQRSLRLADARFAVQTDGGAFRMSRQAPPAGPGVRVGPCFLVASSEPGMAGLCPLRVTAQVAGAVEPPLLLEQTVLIGDGGTMVIPGTLDSTDLRQVAGFEIAAGERCLGTLSLCPTPRAAFTAEGGFRAPQEYAWSASAEEEMNERLNRLLES